MLFVHKETVWKNFLRKGKMENWQICEAECLQYLKKNFSDSKYDFEAEGGSDSTKSDI